MINTTGDGILALLPSTTAAIESSLEIVDRLGDEGLEVRIGIHVGEIDRRGDDVSGLAVNIAARIMSIAGPGQILSSAVAAHTTEAAPFTPAGSHHLEDVGGSWDRCSPADRRGRPAGRTPLPETSGVLRPVASVRR